MAISPPSDIVLDVANAADPAAVRVATARLAALAADPGLADAGFARALQQAGRSQTSLQSIASVGVTRSPAPPGGLYRAADARTDVYAKFEAVLLQSFVETMLPKDGHLFGDKASADVTRSMLAEQLATEIARAGGIGLAKAMQAKHPDAHPGTAAVAS